MRGCSRTSRLVHLMGFLDLVGASLIIPLIIIQVRSLGVSHVVGGAISSIYGVLQVITSPIVGRWSDVIGRRPVMLVCLIATAVSYVVLGASQSLLVVILARILAGHLSELEDGFSLVCNLGGSFFIVNFVLCWMFIPDVPPVKSQSTEEKSESRSLTQMFAFMKDIEWKIFGDIFLVRFFLSFSSLVYRSNFSLLINQNFGASPKAIGYLISFQGIISAVAGFFTGRISKFYKDSQRELYHSSVLLTLSLLGLTVAPSLSILLVCLIPLCISSAVIRVSSSAVTIGRCNPSKVGSVTGFGQSIASVARMVTPLIAGITQEISVYGPGVMGTLSAGVGAAFAGYMARKRNLKEE